MSEIQNLVNELKEIHNSDDAWHGPSLAKILSGVTAAHAARLPVPDYRSIWQVVLHIAAWEEVFCDRLHGKAMAEPAQGDWPPVGETDEKNWREALAFLDRSHERLIQTISSLKDSDLSKPVPGKPYNIGYMLHGLVWHHVYHSGQIALLKRM